MRFSSLILMAVGVLFLLSNFGIDILGIAKFMTFIIRLWPIAFVYVGYRLYKRSNQHNAPTGIAKNKMTHYNNEENIVEDKTSETALDVTIKETIGNLNIGTENEHLFKYNARYQDEKINHCVYRADEQGALHISNAFASNKLFAQLKDRGDCTLGLTPDVPITLNIKSAVGNLDLALGGLQIEDFQLKTGASTARVSFESENKAVMKNFNVSSGANAMRLIGLANAGCQELDFDGGAGKFHFDFSGSLKTDLTASLTCGASFLTFTIPPDIATKVTMISTLSHIQRSPDITQIDETTFANKAFLARKKRARLPMIHINLDAGLSSIVFN